MEIGNDFSSLGMVGDIAEGVPPEAVTGSVADQFLGQTMIEGAIGAELSTQPPIYEPPIYTAKTLNAMIRAALPGRRRVNPKRGRRNAYHFPSTE